ncbi:MAG: TolC family protein [bacterium]
MATFAAAFAACTHAPTVLREPLVPPGPAVYAQGLPVADPAARPAPELPENWQELAGRLTLADIVSIGLANNPETRGSWLTAKAAAARVGMQRSAYLPTIDVEGSFAHVNQSAVGGQFTFSEDIYGASATLNWLLFDFGGRSARLDEAWAALLASDYGHNAVIQDVVLAVEQAFYGYLAAKAQHSAAQANVREAQVNLEAARKRHEVGVATIADVLKAQTAFSQAQLLQQSFAGQIEALKGELATAMGLPASTQYEVGWLPEDVPVEEVTEQVGPLLDKALADRPDLAEARWRAEEAFSRLQSVKAQGWPSISATSSGNRSYYLPGFFRTHTDDWSAALVLRYPLFTGFSQHFDVKRAEAEAEVSKTQVTSLEQQVILEVWTGYSDLKTSLQQVKTTRDLLASAEQSERVALAQYKQGVGSILDLLSAQGSLTTARAEEIRARSNWFLAVARLARATGALKPLERPEARAPREPTTGDEPR